MKRTLNSEWQIEQENANMGRSTVAYLPPKGWGRLMFENSLELKGTLESEPPTEQEKVL